MISTEEIKQFIATDLLKNAEAVIQDDEDLLMSGLLDSINVMRLADHLERACDISIPPRDIVLDNFSTVEKIRGYLSTRVGQESAR